MTDLDLKIFFILNANPASYRFGRLLQQAENQRNTKGALLHCVLPCFTMQKDTFYRSKHHILQSGIRLQHISLL